MAKKKNSFLASLESMDFGKIDMKGVELGGDYSSVKEESSQDKPNKAQNLVNKTPKPKNHTIVSVKTKNVLKSQKNEEKVPKPKTLRIKHKIIGQKPIVKAQNQQTKLEISLEFLKGMDYPTQIEYLAVNGWSLHLERFKGVYFEVAQKYFGGKKFRVYLKELAGIPNYDHYSKTDMLLLQNMMSLMEKKIYLFRRGWAVKVVTRSFQEYEYAVRYFNRKKKMIYLAPYSQEPTQVFLTWTKNSHFVLERLKL